MISRRMRCIAVGLALLVCSIGLQAQTEFWVAAEGVRLYARSFGEGPPLLIINGGPGMNSNGFETVAQRLSRDHRTILYDQRGTGRSVMQRMDASTMTMELMAHDIESIRVAIGAEQLTILGHSFGGMVASYYTALHPDRVAALILSSSGGIDLDILSYARKSIRARLTDAQADSVQMWDKRIAAGDTADDARYRRGWALAPAYLFQKRFVPLLARRLTQGNTRINELLWDDMSATGFDCRKALESVRVPALIIQGRQDIIELRTSKKAHRALHGSQVVVLDSCGHYGWLDKEEEYYAAIGTFLKEHRKPQHHSNSRREG